jgi:hypothetical protein
MEKQKLIEPFGTWGACAVVLNMFSCLNMPVFSLSPSNIVNTRGRTGVCLATPFVETVTN